MRCRTCDYGYVHLMKRASPAERKKNNANRMNDPSGFAKDCKCETQRKLSLEQQCCCSRDAACKVGHDAEYVVYANVNPNC